MFQLEIKSSENNMFVILSKGLEHFLSEMT